MDSKSTNNVARPGIKKAKRFRRNLLLAGPVIFVLILAIGVQLLPKSQILETSKTTAVSQPPQQQKVELSPEAMLSEVNKLREVRSLPIVSLDKTASDAAVQLAKIIATTPNFDYKSNTAWDTLQNTGYKLEKGQYYSSSNAASSVNAVEIISKYNSANEGLFATTYSVVGIGTYQDANNPTTNTTVIYFIKPSVSNTSRTTNSSSNCTTTTLPYTTTYEDVSWLDIGQSRSYPGISGFVMTCGGKVVSNFSPYNAKVFRGTYVPTSSSITPSSTPTPQYDELAAKAERQYRIDSCVRSVRAILGSRGAGGGSAMQVAIQQCYNMQ